jgi:type II secretory pathway pseudopilin PulG
LVVVILVIAALAALLVPAAQRTLDRAKSAQAKNDVTQIVTAVNAYYTEYGKYPLVTADTTYGSTATPNAALLNELRAKNATQNPRSIVFISPPDAKSLTNPRAGIAQQDVSVGGTVTIPAGSFVDPLGSPYWIRIDGGYDNQIPNPYAGTGGAGADPLQQGVIVWSLGKDKTQGKNGNNIYTGSDDIISW